jgi:hypothetical protein
MATIKIGDSLSVEVLTASPDAKSLLAKYLKNPSAALQAGPELIAQLQKDLQLVTTNVGGFGLEWTTDLPFEAGGVSLDVEAGAGARFTVYNHAGESLVDDAFAGPPITVPEGQAFVAFAFQPTVTVTGAPSLGALTFGVEAGTEAEWRFYRPFDLTGPTTLLDACRVALETLAMPNSVEDLHAMLERPTGTMTCVSGRGHLEIACTANVAAALNPLASIDVLKKFGTLTVSGAASATVGVNASVSGDFQVRVQTMADKRIRLGYHTMAGRELGVVVDAAAGPSVGFGKKDLLAMLFGRPASPGERIEEALTAAGVDAGQLEAITGAMKAGLSRKIALELAASLSAFGEREAAFLYEIDLATLDAAGTAAVNKALSGDLSALNRLEPELPAHGIAVVESRTDRLRQRQVRWRLNVVGLLNVLSLQELASRATVVHDEQSGELLITDATTSRKLKAVTSPKDLRKLLYESLILTLTYKAAGLEASAAATSAYSYFKMDRDVNRHEMADYLDAVAAVGLLPPGEIATRLGQVDDFDRGSLLIEAEFDQAACQRMFLDGETPRDRDFYEDVGKLALLALVQEDDADAYRRVPLTNGILWRAMRNSQSSDFGTVLPPSVTGGSAEARKLRVGVVTADYLTIVWWAGAMATAAAKLGEMRAFLGRSPAGPSETDEGFTSRRKALHRAMVQVVQKSPSTFGGDPWGLVALVYASQRSATVTAAVVSPKLTLFLPERSMPAEAGHFAGRS